MLDETASMGFVPQTPSLDPNDILEKLTVERCGGYCFELNGLLAAVLRALGYDLYEAAAHIVKGVDEDTGMVSLKGQNHELILVRGPDDARWRLVDVGYGGNPPIHPLLLEHPSDDSFSGELFRVRRGLLGRLAPPTEEQLSHSRHEAGWYMQRYSESKCKWEDQYFFSEVEALQGDFEVLNWAVATQPTKTFYETLMMGIQRPGGGRVTILNDELRIFSGPGDSRAEVHKLETSEQFQAALERHFKIFTVPK